MGKNQYDQYERRITKPAIPVEIRIIYDKERYLCAISASGLIFKDMCGKFLESDEGLEGRINKIIADVMAGALQHCIAAGTGRIEDYCIHSSIQLVEDVDSNDRAVAPKRTSDL